MEELRILIVYNKKDVYLQFEKGSHPAIAIRHFWGTTTDLVKTKPILIKIISNLRKIISNVIQNMLLIIFGNSNPNKTH